MARRGAARRPIAVAVTLAATLLLPATAGAADPALVSLDTATGLASPGWIDGEISEDATIVSFTADSAALPGGGDGRRRIYLLNRTTGTVTLVSGTAAGPGRANGASNGSMLTPDGRFVLYGSLASNLVEGDVNTRQDAFLFDALTGTTRLVSRPAGDTSQHDNVSIPAGVTADGTRVLFITLEAGNRHRLRLRDLTTKTTLDAAPISAVSAIANAAISDDGTTVAFSTDDRLTPDDTDDSYDVYVRTLDTGHVRRASRPPGAAPFAGDRDAGGPRLSADGARVAFTSESAALGTDGISQHVFVRDLAADTLVVADRAGPSGAIAELGISSQYDLSRDGRYVTFATASTNLHPEGADGKRDDDVFVHDLRSGALRLVSAVGDDGSPLGKGSGRPVVTDSGTVLFQSLTSWDPRDANDARDLYVAEPFASPASGPGSSPGPEPAPGTGPPAGGDPSLTPAAPPALAGIAPGPAARRPPASPAAAQLPLTMRLSTSRMSATAGRRVRFGLRLSRPADVRVTITRAGHRVALLRRSLRAGRSTITWSARSRGRSVRAGRYAVVVRAVSATGPQATGRAHLTIRR